MKLTYAAPDTTGFWRARVYWALSAVGFAVAVAGHVILYRAFAHYPSWLPKLDEPVLFWLLVPPCAVTGYTLMAVLTAQYRSRASRWLAPAIVLALFVSGFIGLLTWDGRWFTATAWDTYLKLLGGGMVLSAIYLLQALRTRRPNA